MEKNDALIRLGLRQAAIFVPKALLEQAFSPLQTHTAVFVANLAQLGFGLDEKLLHALNNTGDAYQAQVLETLREVMGVNKNWTPLVKQWDVPTGESRIDHILTFLANVFQMPGTRLQCGHIIPQGTFPLARYNGCPFCGTPFEFGKIEVMGQGSKLRLLRLWTEKDVDRFMADLLKSKTALDATQIDSLSILLKFRAIPKVDVGMKETLMLLIDKLLELEKTDEVQKLFKSPTDILRYLWFKHTGFLQLVQPRVIVQRKSLNRANLMGALDKSAQGKVDAKQALKLHYNRFECRRAANWLNDMPLSVEAMAEIMHPKREMWVRFIRALRLAEYAKIAGFEKLKALMDVFYKQNYPVFQGRVDHFRLKKDVTETMHLLKTRPGLFARSLFANMLWFGPEKPLAAFAEIIDKVPARLVFTLQMYAQTYFQKAGHRAVKPLGGTAKSIPNNALLQNYSAKDIYDMQNGIEDLCVLAMKKRFAAQENSNKTIYIDPQLFKMPVAIGDRSETVQDMPVALMGTRFRIKGEKVRLFLAWGEGLPAQHLDMDLSCSISYEKRTEHCSYYNLNPKGCKHSGDIQRIPEKIGTAEYIELDLGELKKAGAKYVTFTCNAYSNGELSPNLVVGWMNSAHPMTISNETGVAYDPSCVQHQVRITQNLTKGLVFGVLELATSEIIWLEMAFQGQTVATMNVQTVMSLLSKLDSKLSVGNLLKIKAEAQGLEILPETEKENADEKYDLAWAINAAAVTQLLVD